MRMFKLVESQVSDSERVDTWVVEGGALTPPTPLAHRWLPGDAYCEQHGEWCGACRDDLPCCCDDTHRPVPPHPVS
jgi:hypothetical protein